MGAGQWYAKLLQGAAIGAGAILPGVSGGVLCVIFGLYQPMMALLANPFKTLKTQGKLFLPVLLGAAAGFLGLSGAVAWLFKTNSLAAASLFAGLIWGMMPGLYREAGTKGRPPSAWVMLVISFLLSLAFLLSLQNSVQLISAPDGFGYLLCGAVWGLSLAAPGLSSSSILIALGLYEPMSRGIAALDTAVVLPLLAGILVTLLLAGRMMNRLLDAYYPQTCHGILGVVLASSLLMLPVHMASFFEGLCCLMLAVIGVIFARCIEKLK